MAASAPERAPDLLGGQRHRSINAMPDEQSPRLLRALRHRTGRADARASHVLLYMGDRASSLGHSHLFDLPLPSRGCLLETGLAVTGEKYESGDRRPPSGCPELKRLDHVG